MVETTTITIRDENGIGQVYQELELSFDRIQITVKDLITERVYQEVIAYNKKAESNKHALVQPGALETELNGKKNKQRHVDAEKQVAVALSAFENNGFFILIDDLQAESVDQVITISNNSLISFVKLTQLIGG